MRTFLGRKGSKSTHLSWFTLESVFDSFLVPSPRDEKLASFHYAKTVPNFFKNLSRVFTKFTKERSKVRNDSLLSLSRHKESVSERYSKQQKDIPCYGTREWRSLNSRLRNSEMRVKWEILWIRENMIISYFFIHSILENKEAIRIGRKTCQIQEKSYYSCNINLHTSIYEISHSFRTNSHIRRAHIAPIFSLRQSCHTVTECSCYVLEDGIMI